MARVLSDGTLDMNPLDLVMEEEDAFWGFAVIEVLRHTGIRIEELRELTQLDLHEYEHRDPTIGKVLLLHVNPSKLDKERMVVVAPELAAVFAAMARRIRAAVGSTDPALPSLDAYDHLECENREPRPLLFQRTAGRGCKGITKPFVHTRTDRRSPGAGLGRRGRTTRLHPRRRERQARGARPEPPPSHLDRRAPPQAPRRRVLTPGPLRGAPAALSTEKADGDPQIQVHQPGHVERPRQCRSRSRSRCRTNGYSKAPG